MMCGSSSKVGTLLSKASRHTHNTVYRFEKRGFPHWQQLVLNQVGRPTMYHRVAEDTRQQANVQDCRHLSGTQATLRVCTWSSQFSQMLVVEDKIQDESHIANQKNFNIDEFIWPHGITPPLHHVRKRRFRKRVNRRVRLPLSRPALA